MLYCLLLSFGTLAGVTTVLFGFGGGFVAVPLLYAVLMASHGAESVVGQAAMHIAVATSTCCMIFAASLATLRHHQAGTVHWRQVRPLLGGRCWVRLRRARCVATGCAGPLSSIWP